MSTIKGGDAQYERVDEPLVAVGLDEMDLVGRVDSVPIDQPSELYAKVSYHTGHVGGPEGTQRARQAPMSWGSNCA